MPIAGLADIAHERGALVHSDAAQAVGKIPTRVNDLGAFPRVGPQESSATAGSRRFELPVRIALSGTTAVRYPGPSWEPPCRSRE
ncbi:MAG: aminotransferase class V-fold PLP-dependent enzyme [Deltaproteobacteria bacterium]|nr:aminotransferase class V-fold PLP-dependent enzyme [Deltaproteobacteria bacterium]